jgi:hypothetical protein
VEAPFSNLIAAVAREAPRRHACWDARLFDELAEGPVQTLGEGLQGQPQAEAVLAAYLRLVEEAIGAGYLKRYDRVPAERWPNFLAFCVARLIPISLARVPGNEQIPLLARVWNLGEGLLREPAWVDRYVMACAASLTDLDHIEDFLIRTLEPALTAGKPAHWSGPFALVVLDARLVDDDFLPGDMHLAAPTVLCVHDRRRADVHLGVFLQHDRQSRFLGLSTCLGDYRTPAELRPVRVEGQRMHIGTREAELPLLGTCCGHIVARPGFAVASAVDSQRLWIVESP